MKATIFMALLISAVMPGCQHNSVGWENVAQYPMSQGDTWNYNGLDSSYNFRPNQPGATYSSIVYHWLHFLENKGDTLLADSVLAQKIHSLSTSDSFSESYSGDNFYRDNHDTLIIVAYSGSTGLILPKTKASTTYTINGIRSTSIRGLVESLFGSSRIQKISAGGITYEEFPPKCFVFPLRMGNSWMYRDENGPFLIMKKVVGMENVVTSTGRFSCYKVQWFWDFNGRGVWDTNITGFDYVCSQGLIKRVLQISNVTVTGDDPTPIGTVAIAHEYNLTSLNLHRQ